MAWSAPGVIIATPHFPPPEGAGELDGTHPEDVLYDYYLSAADARIARAEDPRPLVALRERLAGLQAEQQAKDELLERVEEALLKMDAGEAERYTGQLQGVCRRRLEEAKPAAA